MTATESSSASALQRLEALFENVKIGSREDSSVPKKKSLEKRNSGLFETVIFEQRVNKNCDIHGRDSRKNDYGPRRGSVGNILHTNRRTSGMGMRRESTPALQILHKHPVVRRDSGGLGLPPSKSQDPLFHPSSFPSSLRKSSVSLSTSNLRRDSLVSSTGNLRLASRRDSISSIGSGKSTPIGRKDSLSRKYSTDSLEFRRNSCDLSRRGSLSPSGGLDESIFDKSVNGKVRNAKETF